jgi:hypothetical protein
MGPQRLASLDAAVGRQRPHPLREGRIMKQRTHRVTLTVTFDKPCTRKVALEELRDNIHGEFFTTCYALGTPPQIHPDKFKIRSVRSAKS